MRHKVYALEDGRILFIDPSMEILPIIREIAPGFKVWSTPPPPGYIPNLKRICSITIQGMDRRDLRSCNADELQRLHDRLVKYLGKANPEINVTRGDLVTLLDVKIELAWKSLSACDLCGWACGVNRHEEMGKCGLKEKAYCSPPFIHICEEPPVTPAINTKMFGCGMRCIYCQAYEHIEGWQTNPELMELDQKVWGLMEWKRPNAIEFVGGDPTVSLAGILDFLACAPRGFSLPVIWDDSSYGSGKTYNLLEGVVDVWLPDFRYGNNACAKRLSGVDHYWETATAALQIMMKQNARTIVRILVLPSHVRCCNIRVLEWLSQFRDRIWISVLDQYIPEWKAAGHREIGRTPTKEEIMEVKEVVRRFGLRDVNESPEGFWR